MNLSPLGFPIEYISLGFLALGGVFVLFSIIWGFIRGLRKTASRGLFLLITAIILIFVTPLITSWVLNVNFGWLGLQFGDHRFTTITALVEHFLQSQSFYQEIANNPSIMQMAMQIPLIIVNSFIFVLLFWLIKIIFYPLWLYINSIFIKKKNKNGDPYKKRRSLGMLMGAVVGLMIGAFTLMPITGTISLINQLDKETESNINGIYYSGLTTTFAKNPDNAFISDILNEYNNSTMNKIYNYTGLSAVTNLAFDKLSSTTVNGNTIYLKNELVSAANIYINIDRLIPIVKNLNNQIPTQSQLSSILLLGREVVNNVFNSQILAIAGDHAIEYGVNKSIEQNELVEISEDDKQLYDLTMEILNSAKTYTFANLKSDINNLFDAVTALNNANVILPIVQFASNTNENTDFEDLQVITKNLINNPAQSTAIKNAISKFVDLTMVTKLAPSIINYSLQVAHSEFTGEHENAPELVLNNAATIENIKQTLSTTLLSSIEIFNSIDFGSKYYATTNTIVQTGKLLDTLKNYGGLSKQSYLILLKANTDQIKKYINENVSNLPASMTESISAILDKFADIESFENELFTPLSSVYWDVISIIENFDSNNQINSLNFETVGEILDKIKTIGVFENQFENLLASTIDFVMQEIEIPADYTAFVTTVFDGVKNNITPNIVWANELPLIKSFATYLTTLNTSDIDTLLSEDNLSDLGASLDSLKQSSLLSNQLNTVVFEIVEIAKQSLPQNDTRLTIFINSLQQNIKDQDLQKDWESELVNIGKLVNTFKNLNDNIAETDASQIGKTLDQVSNTSVIITKQMVNNLIVTLINEFTNDASFNEIQSTIAQLKQNVDNIESYETELTTLISLVNNLQSMLQVSEVNRNFEALGKDIDTILNSNSKLITRPVVNTLFSGFINDIITNNLNMLSETAKQNMSQKVSDITSFEVEFKTLTEFTDYFTVQIDNGIENTNFVDFGTMLDNTTNSVLINEIKLPLIEYLFDQVIDTSNDISEIINLQSMKTTAINKLQNNELTYTQVMQELDELITVADEMLTQKQSGQNFDKDVVGSSLNTLKQNQIFGTENTAQLATVIIDNLIDILETQKQQNQNNPIAVGIIESKISELENYNLQVESEKQNTNFDYVVLFNQVHQSATFII